MDPKNTQPEATDARPVDCDAERAVYIDNDLVRRTRLGDLAAFEQLFHRHQKRVYSIALQMLNNETEAADATQEAFVRAFQSISKLGSDAAFVTWLKTTAMNVCRDVLRKKARVRIDSLDASRENEDGSSLQAEVADWSNSPERAFDEKHRRECVQKAISSLSPDYREVVTLFYIDGADIAEIAKVVGSPVGTVKSRLSRARAELKRKLECLVR